MLKYIKHHLTGIDNIEVFPVISFTIFFLFFLVLILWVMKSDKKHIAQMSQLPLDNHSNATKKSLL